MNPSAAETRKCGCCSRFEINWSASGFFIPQQDNTVLYFLLEEPVMSEKKENKKKEGSFSIPLRLVPNDAEEIAKEMQEIFDEDKVVHRQGGAEPEHD